MCYYKDRKLIVKRETLLSQQRVWTRRTILQIHTFRFEIRETVHAHHLVSLY